MSIGDARFFTRSGPHSIATVAEAACGTTPETDLLLTGVAPLQAAGPDQVSFLDNRRYAAALEKTSAGAVIIHPDMFPRVPAGVVPILTVGQHRDIAGLGEVDGGDGLARRVQDLAEGKLDGFEPRPEPGEVVGRQGREQAVAGSGTGSGSGLIGEHRKLLRRVSAGALASLCRPRRRITAGDGTHMVTRATIRRHGSGQTVRPAAWTTLLYDYVQSLDRLLRSPRHVEAVVAGPMTATKTEVRRPRPETRAGLPD
jgi:hypothetical protein